MKHAHLRQRASGHNCPLGRRAQEEASGNCWHCDLAQPEPRRHSSASANATRLVAIVPAGRKHLALKACTVCHWTVLRLSLVRSAGDLATFVEGTKLAEVEARDRRRFGAAGGQRCCFWAAAGQSVGSQWAASGQPHSLDGCRGGPANWPAAKDNSSAAFEGADGPPGAQFGARRATIVGGPAGRQFGSLGAVALWPQWCVVCVCLAGPQCSGGPAHTVCGGAVHLHTVCIMCAFCVRFVCILCAFCVRFVCISHTALCSLQFAHCPQGTL